MNETVARARGHLTEAPGEGALVVRGANVCLYVLRDASQGSDLHLRVAEFLHGRAPESKAFDHRHPRVGLQESSAQNNFRRIIAALIPTGEFCNHKINYFSQRRCRLPMEVVVAILNSKLSDWYFRLGSTNAAVSHYQLHNLPCPEFSDALSEADAVRREHALGAVRRAAPLDAAAVLAPGLAAPPFSPAVRDTIVEAVRRIIAIEAARGDIARVDRSALAPAAQPYQDLIDQLIYRMAGLTDAEASGLEERLAVML